ncbi:molybdenum cofactor guanylyltransferase [Sporosarcina contaminans]|uniref:Probable molybdenum cofactor guanylyltransferase n=1 Tax=Sporosarcina contaminans TaxID=633403 RepID=A0ABW3TW76_9BACL
MKTAGILLAGGLSRRFGSPKAFASWQGRQFYERSIDAIGQLCEELVIVTRQELVDRFPKELHVVTDIEPFVGDGPLAGILSGMEAIEADRYIVLPCDMPFTTEEVMRELIRRHHGGVTAVEVDGKRHPLCSIWDASVKKGLRNALENGQRRVMIVQENHGVRWIDGHELTKNARISFENVNTPDILERS